MAGSNWFSRGKKSKKNQAKEEAAEAEAMERAKSKPKQRPGQLNFSAPLLSTRRNAWPVVPDEEKRVPRPEQLSADASRASNLSVNGNGLQTAAEILRDGRVPFLWESSAGRPKEDEPTSASLAGPPHRDGDDFSDALDELSQGGDSYTGYSASAVISVSVIADEHDEHHNPNHVQTQAEHEQHQYPQRLQRTGSSHARNFNLIMDRFLPAAKAIASDSPRQTSRCSVMPAPDVLQLEPPPSQRPPSPPLAAPRFPPKLEPDLAARAIVQEPRNGRPKSRPRGRSSGHVGDDPDDLAELSAKACGLFPWRLRQALSRLSPLPASRSSKKKRRPSRGTLSDGEPWSDTDDEDLTWEAIYRQKIAGGLPSNGGTAVFRRSGLRGLSATASPEVRRRAVSGELYTGGGRSGISPYRNGAPRSPFSEGTGFLGIPPKSSPPAAASAEPRRRSCNSVNDCLWNNNSDVPTPNPSSVRGSSVSGSGSAASSTQRLSKSGDISDFEFRSSPLAATRWQPENYLSKRSLVASMAMLELGKDRDGGQQQQQQQQISNDIDGGNFLVQQKPQQRGDQGWPLGISRKAAPRSRNESRKGLAAAAAVAPAPGPVPPPLPKSPTESWQWRSMPRTPSPNSRLSRLSRSGSPNRRQQQQQQQPVSPKLDAESDAAKWESIVKSSYARSGHLRFSEELKHHIYPGYVRSNTGL